MEPGRPISYLALEPGAEVVTSDGQSIGKVEHILAVEDEDIFEGLVVKTSGGRRFVDAEQVAEMFEGQVVLSLSAAEAAELPEPKPAPAVMQAHPDDDAEGPLERKLRRAWDVISGNY